ncbi:MAG TPA: hypothetical protein PLM29_06880 [Deltaproteobacteria bacterium]|nr:hypothetical protein [Deltaproteobacteria bacterium]
MDMIIIVILTLCVCILIPWMMRRDYQKRMLHALRGELLANSSCIQEHVKNMSENDNGPGGFTGVPGLIDTVFQKMRREEFSSTVLSSKDMDELEKILNFSPIRTGDLTQHSRDIYLEQIRTLEDIQKKIEEYLGSQGAR